MVGVTDKLLKSSTWDEGAWRADFNIPSFLYTRVIKGSLERRDPLESQVFLYVSDVVVGEGVTASLMCHLTKCVQSPRLPDLSTSSLFSGWDWRAGGEGDRWPQRSGGKFILTLEIRNPSICTLMSNEHKAHITTKDSFMTGQRKIIFALSASQLPDKIC